VTFTSKLLDGTGGNEDTHNEKSVSILETFTSFQYVICDTTDIYIIPRLRGLIP